MSDLSDHRPKYRAVLFDLDGTLLDTAPDFLTCTNKLLAQKGMAQLTETGIRRLVTHGSAGIIRGAFSLEPEHPDFEATRRQLLALYFRHLAEKTRPFPGIAELLSTLAEHNIPWGIVTNKPERYTLAILERLPLGSTPAAVICPDHVQQTKPHPESVLLALEQMEVPPQQAVFVGDHLRDIQAGHRAGTATIAATYGYLEEREDPLSWRATHTVESATQLVNLIL